MLKLTSKGDHSKTERYLNKLHDGDFFSNLDQYGQLGVIALSRSTPVDTGLAQSSWDYKTIKSREKPGIIWINTDVENGTSVVILIQYGHGTGTGGYVAGRDFINPAMRPIFDMIADNIWREVTNG